MYEFFLALAALPLFLIVALVMYFTIVWVPNEQRRRAEVEKREKELQAEIDKHRRQASPPEPAKLSVIAKSVDDIVGKYQGIDICRTVRLEDGRTFVFESIAVEKSPGTYHADVPNTEYIVVDKCLLYRELKVS